MFNIYLINNDAFLISTYKLYSLKLFVNFDIMVVHCSLNYFNSKLIRINLI